jgi:HEXXH motif-containing protein
VGAAQQYPDTALVRYQDRLVHGVSRVLPKLLAKVDPDLASGVSPAVAEYNQLSHDAQRGIVHHPYFASWWNRLRAEVAAGGSLTEVERLVGEFGRFIVVPAVRNGQAVGRSFSLRIDQRGEIRFPGTLRHLVMGSDVAGETARAVVFQDKVRFVAGDQTVDVPVAALLGADGQTDERIVTRSSFADGLVELDGSDEAVERFYQRQNERAALPGYPERDLAPYGPVSQQTVEDFAAALRLLDEAIPMAGEELRSYVRVVVPHSPTPDSLVRCSSVSGSHRSATPF